MLQNEVNSPETLILLAAERGLRIVLNTAPYTDALKQLPLEKLDLLVCNETEGEALTGRSESGAILKDLAERCPQTRILITLGANGCRCLGPGEDWALPAERVTPLDTTAAGDTFCGYLTAGLAAGHPIREAAQQATRAAALSVTRPGAADSIPHRDEFLAP